MEQLPLLKASSANSPHASRRPLAFSLPPAGGAPLPGPSEAETGGGAWRGSRQAYSSKRAGSDRNLAASSNVWGFEFVEGLKREGREC